ncbi:proline-rich protein 18-like [Meles meles]|uniref:proline-rich protein 18-like n=1 Tax=Meles meles TaxID=9662 RepID=UPI001E69908C|nr:proline-rich protein 18-like [Meles meles]
MSFPDSPPPPPPPAPPPDPAGARDLTHCPHSRRSRRRSSGCPGGGEAAGLRLRRGPAPSSLGLPLPAPATSGCSSTSYPAASHVPRPLRLSPDWQDCRVDGDASCCRHWDFSQSQACLAMYDTKPAVEISSDT